MEKLRYLAEQVPAANDIGLLVLRVVVGIIFVVHGAGDIFEAGVSNNVENYRGAGIPLPELSAYFAAYVQFLGGLMLIAGLLGRLVSLGMVVVMAGALVFVHAGEQIPIGQDGSGSGFALIMGAASLALVLAGPGRFSADYLIATKAAGSLVATPAIRQGA
jgi:putative oxidoreductase